MKWRTKESREGQRRIVTCFYLFPKECNGIVKWLCFGRELQEMKVGYTTDNGLIYTYHTWVTIKFL